MHVNLHIRIRHCGVVILAPLCVMSAKEVGEKVWDICKPPAHLLLMSIRACGVCAPAVGMVHLLELAVVTSVQARGSPPPASPWSGLAGAGLCLVHSAPECLGPGYRSVWLPAELCSAVLWTGAGCVLEKVFRL